MLIGTKYIHGLNTHSLEMPATVLHVDIFLFLMLQRVFLPPLRGTVIGRRLHLKIVSFLLKPSPRTM